jgi:hypothetical protein
MGSGQWMQIGEKLLADGGWICEASKRIYFLSEKIYEHGAGDSSLIATLRALPCGLPLEWFGLDG